MHPFSSLTLGIFVAGYITARWDLVTRLYELAIFAWDHGVVARAAKGFAVLTVLFVLLVIPIERLASRETKLVCPQCSLAVSVSFGSLGFRTAQLHTCTDGEIASKIGKYGHFGQRTTSSPRIVLEPRGHAREGWVDANLLATRHTTNRPAGRNSRMEELGSRLPRSSHTRGCRSTSTLSYTNAT